MNAKRCVVIGSGLGGLSCGVLLARNGWQVTVLEQHSQPGGCLQCFTRRGARFETGMHVIGSADKGQVLHRLLTFFGVTGDVALSRLDTERYNVYSFPGGERYEIPNGREAFVERLAGYFPRERDNLNRYFDLVEAISRASALHSLDTSSADVATSTRYQAVSVDTVLGKIIGDERLRCALAGDLPLYAAQKGKTPFSTHAFITDFYNQSAFRVQGGSDAIARSLALTLRAAGGVLHTGAKAVAITTEDRRATGVTTDDGQHFEADAVIAATHPARVMEMVDSPAFRPAFRQRIAALPETVGCFSLYMRFRDGKVPYLNHNHFAYSQSSPWGCEDYRAGQWPMGYLYMHFSDAPSQKWARSGVALSFMRWQDVLPWAGTAVGRRGNNYEKFKRDRAQRLLALMERDFPGITNQIDDYWTATPLTYRDYTGTEQGAMYGVARDITLGGAGRVQHRTKLQNLYLAGQNINSHGILGVLVGTIVACSEILGSDLIFSQIKSANE